MIPETYTVEYLVIDNAGLDFRELQAVVLMTRVRFKIAT